MPLANLSPSEAEKLVESLRREFRRRDTLWRNRRKVRFRDMEKELRSLPLSKRADASLLVYQTEEVNQEVHRRVKRLVANRPRIQVIAYDDSPSVKSRAQELEDALRALYNHLTSGPVSPEEMVVEAQQGDGLGIWKLEYIPGPYASALSNLDPEALQEEIRDDDPDDLRDLKERFRERLSKYNDEAEGPARAYNDLVQDELKSAPPPFRLVAVDPLACYWRADENDNPVIVAEVGRRPLSPLLKAINASGKYRAEVVNGRIAVMPGGSPALTGTTTPEDDLFSPDSDDEVEVIELRTRHEILLMVRHPDLSKPKGARSEGGWAIFSYDNPFGPVSTGYFLIPGDITNQTDPAYRYQPPVLGLLNVAQADNLLTTIRLSAAVDAALRKRYISTDEATAEGPSTADEPKTADVREGQELVQIPGEIRIEEAPNIDLDKADVKLQQIASAHRIHEVLVGDATSADSGHKLAIQVAQADMQMVPYQTRRAHATAALLKAIVQAASYIGLPIYVKELPRDVTSQSRPEGKIRRLDPSRIDFDYDILVTVGSETAVTKFARWAALSQRFERGTLSFETLMESSDVENPEEEMIRIFEGRTLLATMERLIPVLVDLALSRAQQRIQERLAPPNVEQQGGLNPDSAPVAGVGRVPGVGMSPAGPTTGEFGPRTQIGAGEGMTIPGRS